MDNADINEKNPEIVKRNVFQKIHLPFWRKNNKRIDSDESKSTDYSYLQLFRFATTAEWAITLLGLIVAAIGALVLPIYMIVYGELTAMFGDRIDFPERTSTQIQLLPLFGGGTILTNASREENRDALIADSKAFGLSVILCSIIQLLACAISVDLVNYSALKQISRIRKEFLRSVLRQEMAWFDTSAGGNFATRITDNLEKIKEGISEKLAIFVYLMSSFVVCVSFAFYYGWKLTSVILSCTPFIIVSTALAAKIQNTLNEKELASYSAAGDVADEVLSGIRTVTAFGGESKELQRYKERLEVSLKSGQKKGLYSGLSGGCMWMLTYWSYSVAFWYGIYLILLDRSEEVQQYTPAVLMIILFCVLVGAQNLGMSSPQIEAFSMASSAASGVFSVIDRKSTIDSLSPYGLRPLTISGNIEFRNVHFRYPARINVNVLNGLNLTIKAGQTVALVGPSGCGKSTCLQLVQRLYDVLEGSILFEGTPIKEINTTWLRTFIGVVGQEPVLFSTTIAENIRYGNPQVTMEGIQNAARIANCHDFIQKLPNGYDTMISVNGQLSGGQKQRIAIARALVRNPKILLLDEATSALDPNSEKRVQHALDRASKGRTTIVVSHRLSTITNADRIIYIDKGVVAEDGSHKELMELKGLYYSLVSANNANYEKKKDANLPLNKVIRRRLSSTSPSVYSGDSESGEDSDEEGTKVMETSEAIYPVSMLRLINLNAKEWPYILVGSLAAVVMGASLPTFAVIFGEFFGVMAIIDEEELNREVNWLSIAFILLGLMAGLATFLQTFMFNTAGSRLTCRLREETFQASLKQEMGWFDQPENSVGALGARLSGDCASVQGATGMRIGSILQSISTIMIGVGISLYYSWKLTVVSIVLVPVVLAACFFESRYMAMSNLEEKRSMEQGCRMAVEAISQIRTVASLNQESHVIERYMEEMAKAERSCRTKIRYRGLVFSLGQSMPYFGYALCLWYGGILVAREEMPYKDVIKISEALIFGSWILGQALAYAPNVNTAVLSAGRLLRLLDRIPQYSNPTAMPHNNATKTGGNIKYTDLEFHYPTRADVPVLRGLNLEIKKGQTVALVGPSGCGKSTCIQLLLRYYDPINGSITLDGTPTTDFPMARLRLHLGLVSQEPVLFDRTIAENIAYGDNSRNIPLTEIIEAAKLANIHTFVTSLPLGYETRLGKRGTQLSGGQKQRIAIARALIRNPSILLLDEATSALDSQSENIVQAALDRARAGRTCITIAHRLTTIQNADLICVINGGVVIEQGTHSQLMAAGQTYAKLYEMQQVD